jgi:Mrp family chromosome partitioning ATPase/LPS O-antigen subunit length determinant protein (WzzB/FepE family)
MTDDLQTSPSDASTTLSLIVRRWWMVAACAFAGACLAVVLAEREPPKYRATASVLQGDSALSSTLPSADSQQIARTTMTATELIQLPVITEAAAEQVGGGVTSVEIAQRVAVANPQDSDLLQIFVEDGDARRSAAIANAVAEAYVNFRSERVASQLDGARRRLEDRLAQLPTDQREGAVGTALRDQIGRLSVATALNARQIDVVQPAVVPLAPSGPNRSRVAMIGLVLGGLLGCALAYLLGRLDRQVRSPRDLGALLDAPVLAALRQHPVYANGSGRLRSRDLEPFRLLWTRLRLGTATQGNQIVLVTSASRRDGKTTIAWHLALTAAQLGDRALLVEADLLSPSLAQRYHLRSSPGVSEALAGSVTLQDAIQTPSSDVLGVAHPFDVLVAGDAPDDQGRIADLVDDLGDIRGHYDLIVIDSSALLSSADTLRLARQVDGIILVGWLGRVERDAVQFLKDDLKRLAVPLLGVVANADSAEIGRVRVPSRD